MELLRQAARFLIVGTAGTAIQLLLYLLLILAVPDIAANAVAWLLSTIVTNAAHRHITFGVRSVVGADEWVGLITSAAALGVSTLALAVAGSSSGGGTGALIVVAANVTVGTARFLVMRLWFSGRRRPIPSR